MLLQTKSGKMVEIPSEEEDAQINAGIESDPDAFEWNDEDFKQAMRFDDAPETMKPSLNVRGKQKAPTKIAVTLRYSPEVIEAFKATGKGWQTRIDDALKEWLRDHSAA